MGKGKPPYDDDPGMDFSRTMDGISETLQKAGYRLESEKDLSMGLMAYNAAALIKLAILRGHGDGGLSSGTGRNDPCPCGSGKKFKKCCLGRKVAEEKSAWKPEPGPGVEPELIPNLRDMESVHHDLAILAGLFETDPELRKIRFPRKEAADFAEEALAASPSGVMDDPDRLSAYIDEIAHRYVTEVEGGELLESLSDKLTEAARRARGPEEVRSLVLGTFYCTTAKAAQGGPNPMECLLFRMSMNEQVEMLSNLDRTIEGLGSRKELARRFLRGDSELRRKLEEHVKTMDPVAIDAMKESFYDNMEKMSDIIKRRGFPVPLPLATVFPMLARLYRADGEGKTDGPLIQEIVMETLDGLDPEDLRLYGGFLDEWIRSDDGSDAAVTAMVHQVRGMAAGGNLRPLDGALLIAALEGRTFSLIKGEENLLKMHNDLLDHGLLDQYGGLLEDSGFPALARRIRNLAVPGERLAAPSAGKKEKKRKKKQARGG